MPEPESVKVLPATGARPGDVVALVVNRALVVGGAEGEDPAVAANKRIRNRRGIAMPD